MRILIAEDDPVCCRLLEATLERHGYEVVVACDGNEASRLLRAQGAPRLAVLDWMMPGIDGIQLCRQIRTEADWPYVYVILLTSRDRKQDVIEGLDAGADDYLVKPFDAHELKARLCAGRRIIELQDQLIAARESLREQATHDSLTALWNRPAILDILQRELERARRFSVSVGVIMADVDHFKQVNDTRGHLVGDAVLREIGRRMLACLRPYDTIGRYGGEEFLVVLPECDGMTTFGLAQRLLETINGTPIACPDGPVYTTLSLGAVSSTDGAVTDPAGLLRAADAALYQAKSAGRNRVEMAPVWPLAADLTQVSTAKAQL